jgi:hypothetical protein
MEKTLIISTLKKIVKQLVNTDYGAICESDLNKQIFPDEIATVVNDYPGKLTYPPEYAFNSFEDYGHVKDSENQIEFSLWYDNKLSDLTISATIYELGQYSLDDIRVM